jgi:hypothetical protein
VAGPLCPGRGRPEKSAKSASRQGRRAPYLLLACALSAFNDPQPYQESNVGSNAMRCGLGLLWLSGVPSRLVHSLPHPIVVDHVFESPWKRQRSRICVSACACRAVEAQRAVSPGVCPGVPGRTNGGPVLQRLLQQRAVAPLPLHRASY